MENITLLFCDIQSKNGILNINAKRFLNQKLLNELKVSFSTLEDNQKKVLEIKNFIQPNDLFIEHSSNYESYDLLKNLFSKCNFVEFNQISFKTDLWFQEIYKINLNINELYNLVQNSNNQEIEELNKLIELFFINYSDDWKLEYELDKNNDYTNIKCLMIKQNKLLKPNIKLARKRLENAKIIKEEINFNDINSNLGKNKTYHIKTYGCQSNVRDSETFKGICEKIGYTWNDDIFSSDLVILNTCAIRENAENKVFGEIGSLKNYKSKNPNMLIGVSGCMSQSEKVVNTILNKYQYVDFIIGTHNIHKLVDILENAKLSSQMIVEVWSKEGDIIENLPISRDNNQKAWINIMFGCDKFCTYCIVPYTRGKIRSRLKKDILDEVKHLIDEGYLEITLLGQNVNDYGIDFEEKDSFYSLLEDVAKTGVKRIRFTTSNPWNWDNRIIDLIKKYPNIMPYFHLPIQSGSESILKKMNRSMLIKDYIQKIKYIRENIKYASISTDIIVGFPNETDEEFNETINLYNIIKYDNAYTFIFSPREGTYAATIKDEISNDIKKQRLHTLNELVKKYSKENNDKYIGKVIEVLIDGNSRTNPDKLTGYSPNWKVVNFDGDGKIGEFVKVKILTSSRFSLNGIQIKD